MLRRMRFPHIIAIALLMTGLLAGCVHTAQARAYRGSRPSDCQREGGTGGGGY